MVSTKYSSKETKDFYNCFNEVLSYINTLKIDDEKKREKNKLNKLNEHINNCKEIIDEKKVKDKSTASKLNYYNIYTIDINNIEHNRPHLNILKNDIEIIINSQKENKDNILSKYAKIWKTNIDDKTKKEYKKLTKNKIFLKKDYDELLLKGIQTTPKQKRKEINKI